MCVLDTEKILSQGASVICCTTVSLFFMLFSSLIFSQIAYNSLMLAFWEAVLKFQ